MDNEIKQLATLTQTIEQEKNIDVALDNFISGAQLVKKILGELDEKEGQVYEVIDGVEKLWEE